MENTSYPSESPAEESNPVNSEVSDSTAHPVQVVGFWLAVVLPFIHLPLLARGLTSQGELIVFLGLIGLNIAAFYAGRNYRVD